MRGKKTRIYNTCLRILWWGKWCSSTFVYQIAKMKQHTTYKPCEQNVIVRLNCNVFFELLKSLLED